jgi:ABC-type taurine transport system ATPase subunit
VLCYRDGIARLYSTVDDSDELIASSNSVPVMRPIMSRIVHRFPNDFSTRRLSAGGNQASTLDVPEMSFRSNSRSAIVGHSPKAVR